jgi:hypothetical protein
MKIMNDWDDPFINDIQPGDAVRYSIRTDLKNSTKLGTVSGILENGNAIVLWIHGAENVGRENLDIEEIPLSLLEKVDIEILESALDDIEPSCKS